MSKIVFLDCETTGLSVHRHEVWEVALIERTADKDLEHVFHVRPDLTKADPNALRVCRFYERTAHLDAWQPGKPGEGWQMPREVAATVARLLDGAFLVASNPTFDASFLQRFLFLNAQVATWQYHLIDVRALAVGYLHGQARAGAPDPLLPENLLTSSSQYLGASVGVQPTANDAKHTALGDARWVRDVYDAIATRAAA